MGYWMIKKQEVPRPPNSSVYLFENNAHFKISLLWRAPKALFYTKTADWRLQSLFGGCRFTFWRVRLHILEAEIVLGGALQKRGETQKGWYFGFPWLVFLSPFIYQKPREGCGCFRGLFGRSRGKLWESPGKIAG